MFFPSWFLGNCVMKQRYWKADISDALQWELDEKNVRITDIKATSPTTTVIRFTKHIRIPIWYFNERSEYFEATINKEEKTVMVDRYVKDVRRSPKPYIQNYDLYYIDQKGKLNQVRHIYWAYLPVKLIEFMKYTLFWIGHQSRYLIKVYKPKLFPQ